MTSIRKARELPVRAASASGAALVALVLPKCPLCVAAYLGAIGVGAGVARGAAAVLRPGAFGIATVLVFALLFAVWRQRKQRSAVSRCCATRDTSALSP